VKARLVVHDVSDEKVTVGISLGAVAAERDAAGWALEKDAAAEKRYLLPGGQRVGGEASRRLGDEMAPRRAARRLRGQR
jgi:hypothetical protein